MNIKTRHNDLDLLSLLKHPEEGGHGTEVEGVRGDAHDVVQDASQLSEQNCKQSTEHTHTTVQSDENALTDGPFYLG